MSEENPFETDATEVETAQEGDVEATDDNAAEFDDVETVPATNEDVEELPAATPTAAPAQATATAKAPARPPVPEGYITPVQFAKELTERELKAGRINAGEAIAPQVIYSFVKQGQRPNANAETSLKSYTDGGRENLLKRDEAFAWWDAKAKRKTDREDAKKAAAAAAAAKAAATPAATPAPEAPAEPVTEVE